MGILKRAKIPLVLFFGIFYFFLKYFVDVHLFLNIFKNEFDSNGRIFNNICGKFLYLLILFQICIFFKIFFVNRIMGCLVFIVIFVSLLITVFENKNFLKVENFKERRVVVNEEEEIFDSENRRMEMWYSKYAHPMTIKANIMYEEERKKLLYNEESSD